MSYDAGTCLYACHAYLNGSSHRLPCRHTSVRFAFMSGRPSVLAVSFPDEKGQKALWRHGAWAPFFEESDRRALRTASIQHKDLLAL